MARKGSQLKVLMVSALYPPTMVGGAETLVFHLANELAARGHQPTVLTSGPRGSSSDRMESGVRIATVSVARMYWPFDGRRRGRLARAAWHVLDTSNRKGHDVVAAMIRQLHPDVVHTHTLSGFSPAVWAAAATANIPIVHTAHDYYLSCPRTTLVRSSGINCVDAPIPCLMYRRSMMAGTTLVDLLVAPSQFALDLILSHGARPRASRLIRNGVPLEPVIDKAEHEPFTVLYLGQLGRHKGVAVLLDAIARLGGRRMRFLIAGRGELEDEVRRATLDDRRIEYVGFVDAEGRLDLLRSADVLVVPSVWRENAGLVVLEAFGSGVTVIATNSGGLPELVRDGETGLLVPPGDPQAIADAILRLASSTQTRSQLADRILTEREVHSVTRMGDEYENAYQGLLR